MSGKAALNDEDDVTATVIVMGDVGRSPRMQYHTLSLLQHTASVVADSTNSSTDNASKDNLNINRVNLVGYEGTALIPQLMEYFTSSSSESSHFQVHRFSLERVESMGLIYYYIHRIMFMAWNICTILHDIHTSIRSSSSNDEHNKKVKKHLLLVQNPPAVPILLMCVLYKYAVMLSNCFCLRRSKVIEVKLILDWHNLGYTMLLEKNQQHTSISEEEEKTSSISSSKRLIHNFIVFNLYVYEWFVSRHFDMHICVSRAMRVFLKRQFGVRAELLYDRPPSWFRSCTRYEKQELFDKIGLSDYKDSNKWKILVSSTSYTPDEDFSILLDALKALEKELASPQSNSTHSLLVVVTGKGPLKSFYEGLIEDLNAQMTKIVITTIWLEPEDYPIFLGCANYGVCLHTSTSGLDLPMKVYDMFGAGLPVCAVNYDCIDELVYQSESFDERGNIKKKNGFIFKNSSELNQQLLKLICDEDLELIIKVGVAQISTWEENWNRIARRTIQFMVRGRNLRTRRRSKDVVARNLFRTYMFSGSLCILTVIFRIYLKKTYGEGTVDNDTHHVEKEL